MKRIFILIPFLALINVCCPVLDGETGKRVLNEGENELILEYQGSGPCKMYLGCYAMGTNYIEIKKGIPDKYFNLPKFQYKQQYWCKVELGGNKKPKTSYVFILDTNNFLSEETNLYFTEEKVLDFSNSQIPYKNIGKFKEDKKRGFACILDLKIEYKDANLEKLISQSYKIWFYVNLELFDKRRMAGFYPICFWQGAFIIGEREYKLSVYDNRAGKNDSYSDGNYSDAEVYIDLNNNSRMAENERFFVKDKVLLDDTRILITSISFDGSRILLNVKHNK